MDRCPPKLEGIGGLDQWKPSNLSTIQAPFLRVGRNRHPSATSATMVERAIAGEDSRKLAACRHGAQRGLRRKKRCRVLI